MAEGGRNVTTLSEDALASLETEPHRARSLSQTSMKSIDKAVSKFGIEAMNAAQTSVSGTQLARAAIDATRRHRPLTPGPPVPPTRPLRAGRAGRKEQGGRSERVGREGNGANRGREGRGGRRRRGQIRRLLLGHVMPEAAPWVRRLLATAGRGGAGMAGFARGRGRRHWSPRGRDRQVRLRTRGGGALGRPCPPRHPPLPRPASQPQARAHSGAGLAAEIARCVLCVCATRADCGALE